MKDEGKKTILISMPISLWREIKNASHEEHITLSSWVRNLIIKELKK